MTRQELLELFFVIPLVAIVVMIAFFGFCYLIAWLFDKVTRR